jgi:hypothetical protein
MYSGYREPAPGIGAAYEEMYFYIEYVWINEVWETKYMLCANY